FLCWSNLTFSPIVQKSFAKLYYSIAKESSSFNFQDNTFMRIGDFRIHIEQICKKNNVLKKVSIYKISSNSNQVMRIYASDGRVIFDSLRGIIFNLTNGVIQTFEKKFPESATHFRFGKYTLTVPFIENNIGFYSQTLREFTGRELLLEIKKYRENKLPTNYLEREYNLRWSIGTAAFFLVFTGLPLGVLFHRRGRSTGFGLSLLIISLYYFLLIGGITLADKGIVSSVLALWIPNIVIFSFGTLLFHRMVKK
ncbi:MAG: LptF/LptG family permease, partial [Elusimicrobiota bacterium]